MRTHVEIGDDGSVCHQSHLGLSRGAGGHVENGEVRVGVFGLDLVEGLRVGDQNTLAFGAEGRESGVVRRFAREENPELFGRNVIPQTLKRF